MSPVIQPDLCTWDTEEELHLGPFFLELLRIVGYKVDEEYYVNDHGRQMNILTISTWLRYLQQNGQELEFSKKGYQGEYVEQLAKELLKEESTKYNLKENESDLLELLAITRNRRRPRQSNRVGEIIPSGEF